MMIMMKGEGYEENEGSSSITTRLLLLPDSSIVCQATLWF